MIEALGVRLGSAEARPIPSTAGPRPAALHRSNWGTFNRWNWGVFVRRRQFWSFYLVMDGVLQETERHLKAMTNGDLTTVANP